MKQLTERSFNSDVWPDPAGMAAEVKRLTGAELMVSLWPSVEDLSENYLTLQEDGLLAITRDGSGVQDSFEGVYTRLGLPFHNLFVLSSILIHSFQVDSTNPAAREFICRSFRNHTQRFDC